MRVKIFTGRTHQIRVHSASIGHPIVGDDKYGDFELNKRIAKNTGARMFLHAHSLKFTHPQTGEVLTLSAPIPAIFSQFMNDHG